MGIQPGQIEAAGEIQRAAASDELTRVRLIAGPGTGKSFSIEDRVLWLLEQGVASDRIAAVSFTRAAAQDLQRRVRIACARVGREGTAVRVTTLHSLALRSLRAAGALGAYPVDPAVLDSWEQEQVFDAEFGRVAAVGSIPRRREIRIDHETFWSTGYHGPRPAQDPPEPPITEAERNRFRAFHGPRTQLYACVLPGEIVQKCVQLIVAGLLEPVELLNIGHVIVDEFQDLNPMDLDFVCALEQQGASLFVAGDDDQSLYSFRYANPEGIQGFTERFDPVGDHVLRYCFRCTPEVLAAADALITNFAAPTRIPKHLVSLYEESDPPVAGGFGRWSFADANDEAEAIAVSCRRLIDAGLPAREIMVLLSNPRALFWQLRDQFDALEVPYEPPRVAPFKNTSTGRAILTALRIGTRPDDFVALRTLLTLLRGIGIGTATAIADTAIASNLNFRNLFYAPLPENPAFAPRAQRALRMAQDVCAELGDWEAEDTVGARADGLDQAVAMILGDEPDGDWRDELTDLPPEATLEELISLLTAERDDERWEVLTAVYNRLGQEVEREGILPDRVQVMTMHGAKGLAATVVFIPGLEEQILPGERRGRYSGQVLEAARMLYVAMTRARLGCVVSYATTRFMNGEANVHNPSRYAAHLGGPFRRQADGMSTELARQVVRAAADL